MKRRQRQGRRQHEEAQILIGRKASPDTPAPAFCPKSPGLPGGGFSFAQLQSGAATASVHTCGRYGLRRMQMETKDIVTIIALILGPVLAVGITLWSQRRSEKLTASGNYS